MATITYHQQCDAGCSDTIPTNSEDEFPLEKETFPSGKYPRIVQIDDFEAGRLNTCKWARSTLVKNSLTNKYAIVGITCKRWGCPECAREKTRDLANWVKLAAPNKLLTLTVNPKCHDNPELAWLSTAPLVPELIRALRKRFGPIEYLRVCELHQSGWPHYHCMLRSDFLPRLVVKKIWQELTGAEIVDIREVSRFFNSFQYLVKYLTKLRRIDWTDRHVTYSRRFFPVSITKTTEPSEWRPIQSIPQNPLEYLTEFHNHEYLRQTGPYAFDLPSAPSYWLPAAERDPTEKPKTQRLIPAFDFQPLPKKIP
jgi:hypothetical protein